MVEPVLGLPVKGARTALRLVFCGTPPFAVPSLHALLHAGHEVLLVLTQPDRPSGRGMKMTASAVKAAVLDAGLPIDQPEKIRGNEALRARLEALEPDAIVVVAYGRIVPPWMLALPRLGCINLHGSLLPKYRGAAPIQWAVANGDPGTGVTTMLLEEGLDTGPMLQRAELPVSPEATAEELFVQLAELGAPLLVSTLDGLAAGTLEPVQQDDALATHAPLLTRDDGRIDSSRPARVIFDRWRGFQPWPGAWALLDGRKFTVTRMRPVPDEQDGPGVLAVRNGRLLLGCGDGRCVELLEVQLEGKRAAGAADFLRGHPSMGGIRLG